MRQRYLCVRLGVLCACACAFAFQDASIVISVEAVHL